MVQDSTGRIHTAYYHDQQNWIFYQEHTDTLGTVYIYYWPVYPDWNVGTMKLSLEVSEATNILYLAMSISTNWYKIVRVDRSSRNVVQIIE